jgi:hypothetical protein
MSSNVCTVWNRRPGEVGLYLRIGIFVIPTTIGELVNW